ncbi:ChaB family protein [Herbiconiux sp. CPCC 205716]|uniref:ChaB family protein n=1 Tax=Herbiconiux gentiana TaxID=2970912 RepID=A0ABT2GIN3_9MICO|nr:ChaB family protein [Herbiconiux gentiana]MCS5715457.1 ChaB family protein [Herbiconiux gentiana]
MPASDELPSTLARSEKHAQALWSAAHDSAVDSYGEGERAHRTAFAALKHEYEKVGDHWERKDESGPSDSRAEGGRGSGETEEGVDANATKAHLLELAKRLDVRGRSRMTKDELVEALKKANRRETARAR